MGGRREEGGGRREEGGGRREVSIISHRPVTRSDLKHERTLLRGSVSTFLQLVVAFNQFHLAWACSRVRAILHPLLSYL